MLGRQSGRHHSYGLLTSGNAVESHDLHKKICGGITTTIIRCDTKARTREAMDELSYRILSESTCSPLSPSITHSLFHSRLKTHLYHKSFPPYSLLAPIWTAFSDYTGPDLLCSTVFHFKLIFFFIFIFGHAVD